MEDRHSSVSNRARSRYSSHITMFLFGACTSEEKKAIALPQQQKGCDNRFFIAMSSRPPNLPERVIEKGIPLYQSHRSPMATKPRNRNRCRSMEIDSRKYYYCFPDLFNFRFFSCFSTKVGNLNSPGTSSDDCKLDNKVEVSHTPTTEVQVLSSSLRKFSFHDLRNATRNFRPDSLLGEGGFGHVFKGWVELQGTGPAKPGTGLVVAVKILNPNGLQGHKEWLAEVNYLGEVHHPHLVKLVGYCIEGDQRLLVYEFMQRGSLENHLFCRGAIPLSWKIRMKIAWGAAMGLAFLHGREQPIIFRDFKTSNILLDAEYNAKLSDFGLARDGPQGDKTHVSTRVMGTYGYAAPEYVMTGHLTSRSDIYSFGVVLLEIITGRRSVDKTRPNGQHNLVDWANPFLNGKKKIMWLVDPRLQGSYSIKGVQAAASLAARCLCRDPKMRPTIQEVLRILKFVLQQHKDTPGSRETKMEDSIARMSSESL